MKCPHCGTEWTIQKTTSQTVFCPGCGKPCRTAPEKQKKMDTLEDCLRYLSQKFGEETLRNGKQLIGYHSDLMPNRERDRKLLRMLVSCDGQIALLEAKKKSAGEQSVAIARLAKKMQDNMFAPDPVREVCTAFWLAIGGSREALKGIQPQSAPAPAPKPAPKPTPRPIPPNAVCSPSDYEISGGVLIRYKGRDKIIRIPDGVTEIGEKAFFGVSFFRSSTIEEVWLPDGVKKIGASAFELCGKLRSISLPAGLKTIERSAFCCTPLKSITFSDGLLTIGDSAFYGCDSLESITFPDGLRAIDKSAFVSCNSLKSVTFPRGLQAIGEMAFWKCRSLKSITLPDGLQTIEDLAFASCSALVSITLPAGLQTIGKRAFWGCSSLTSITLPDGLQTIGREAFENCSSLKSITIPDSVTGIDETAFKDCSGITVIASDAWKKAHPDLLRRIEFPPRNA